MNYASARMKNPNLWTHFLAFSLSCVVTRLTLSMLSFNLTHFRGRQIGQPALDSVDATFRNATYALAIVIFVITFILVRFSAQCLNNYWKKKAPGANLAMEKSVLLVLSLMILAQEVFAVVAKNAGQFYDLSTVTWLIYLVVVLSSSLKVICRSQTHFKFLACWPGYNLLLALALSAVSITIVTQGFLLSNVRSGITSFVVAVTIYFCLILAYSYLGSFFRYSSYWNVTNRARLLIRTSILRSGPKKLDSDIVDKVL